MVQGVDESGESYGWEAELDDGPFPVLTEFPEVFSDLNIPDDDDLNPSIDFIQSQPFHDCNNRLQVGDPSVHDGTYNLCSQYLSLLRIDAHWSHV